MARVEPTISVALTGEGMSPEKVTVRALAEILSAVQTLISGRDEEPDDDDQRVEKVVADKDSLSLLDVKKGSAVFPCLARAESSVDNLKRVGQFLKRPGDTEDDRFAFALRPTKVLSAIARQLSCMVEIRPRSARRPLAVIRPGTYDEVYKSLVIEGNSSVSGSVQRVGGATNMRCALRVPGRERLLYCDVASPDVSRKLGESLYQDIVATGRATWFQRSWSLYAFEIANVRPLRRSRLSEAIKAIYEAGGKGWDEVREVEETLKGLR